MNAERKNNWVMFVCFFCLVVGIGIGLVFKEKSTPPPPYSNITLASEALHGKSKIQVFELLGEPAEKKENEWVYSTGKVCPSDNKSKGEVHIYFHEEKVHLLMH